MKKMTVLDRVFLLITGLLAAYQIAVGIDDGLAAITLWAYTIAFGVLLIAGLLLIIMGFEILESPLVVIVSTLIPLSLSLGLVWEYLPDWRVPYLIFVIVGFLAVVALIRRKPNGYRNTIIALVAGLVVGGLHMATSRALRGSSMPLDFIVYATAFTLLVFLLFRIPGIRNKLNLTGEDDTTSEIGAGVAMIVSGIVILTVQIWAGPTHMIDGVNYADVWHTQMAIIGGALTILGAGLLLGVMMGAALPHPLRRFKTQPARIIK